MKKMDVDLLKPEQICFVISPIGEKDSETRKRSDKLLKHIVEPAAEVNDLIAVRSDQITAPGMITQQVIQHIMNDRMVIADLTDHNANVFYELALRHAFRKPVVQLISTQQRIPFDVQGSRTVYYLLDLDNAVEAREEVTRQINTALSEGFEIQSPVTIAASLADLSRSSTPASQVLMQTILDQEESSAIMVIRHYTSMLSEYVANVEKLLSLGKSLKAQN